MIQYFEVRIKRDAPEEATPQEVADTLAYEINAPLSVISATEDVQARGMGEPTAADETEERGDEG